MVSGSGDRCCRDVGITVKTAIHFLEWLNDRFSDVRDNYQAYLGQLLNTKPSANGYDLMVTGCVTIMAEIRCKQSINNGYEFGPKQKKGIIKDIRGLLSGKYKVKSVDLTTAFKFRGIYDLW